MFVRIEKNVNEQQITNWRNINEKCETYKVCTATAVDENWFTYAKLSFILIYRSNRTKIHEVMYGLRHTTIRVKARTHGATLRATLCATWKLHRVSTLEIVARNVACNCCRSRIGSYFCNITRNICNIACNKVARSDASCVRALS